MVKIFSTKDLSRMDVGEICRKIGVIACYACSDPTHDLYVTRCNCCPDWHLVCICCFEALGRKGLLRIGNAKQNDLVSPIAEELI